MAERIKRKKNRYNSDAYTLVWGGIWADEEDSLWLSRGVWEYSSIPLTPSIDEDIRPTVAMPYSNNSRAEIIAKESNRCGHILSQCIDDINNTYREIHPESIMGITKNNRLR